MAYAGGDRIKEICNNPGTSAFVLTGPVAGEIVRAFSSAEDGQYLRYLAKHTEAAESEIGVGLYTHSSRTLTRRHRSYPSEGAAVVTFSPGVVHIASTPSVRDVVPWQAASDPAATDDIDDGFIRGNHWINTTSGAVFVCVNPAPGAAVWHQINAAAGAIASEAEARAGTDNTKTQTPLRTTQTIESYAGITSTGFNPASVQIDVDRLYDTYTQSGADGFSKNAAGTFRNGKVVRVPFNSDGSALTWDLADFESFDLVTPLPSMLPAGLHMLLLSWDSHRGKIQVAWASRLAEGAVLKDYSEVAPAASVSGSITRSFADGNVHVLTLTATVTAVAITGAPPAGELGVITFILIAGAFGWAHPTGTRLPDGAPVTISGRAWVSYATVDGGNTFDLLPGPKALS